MKHDFKKTDQINSLENEINNLEDELVKKKNLLCEEYQKEVDKQFELVQGKTIFMHGGKVYVYKGLSKNYYNWIEGNSIRKNGVLSKNVTLLFDDWEMIGKEYNNDSKQN
jgi:hypothetical protein